MIHARKLIATAAVCAMILAACGDASELAADSDPDPAPQDEDEGPNDEPDEESDGEPDNDEQTDADQADDELDDLDEADDIWQFVEDFDDPFVHEDGGVRLSITGLALSDVTSDDFPADVAEFLEDDTQTAVVLEMTASNDSGSQIDFYPGQGEIQLGREQVQPDLWFTESLAGMDWRDGVDDTGQVFYELEQDYEDAVAEESLTFIANDPMDEDFNTVGEGFEIEVTWDS